MSAAVQQATSPLHSLLLRHKPLQSASVQYRPKPYHRRRPRTLHRYEDGTLVLYDEEKKSVDRVISAEEAVSAYGSSRLKIGEHGGYVKFGNGKEELRHFLERSVGDAEEVRNGERWRFVRKVGGGSGGSVWLVETGDGVMGVKVVEKEGLADGEHALKRVVEERRAMEVVGGSEDASGFVVGLEGAWQSQRRLYLGMRWFDYGDLGRVTRGRVLREEVVKGIVAEIVLGLQELKEMGFVHRDLKVENVFVNDKGHVAIGDLGMIKFIGNGDGQGGKLGRTRSFCGTRSSMAPEMIMGKEYGYSVDMWALGVLIYRLLTGKMPFGRSSYKIHGGQAASSIALFHEIKTAPVKYPEFLSDNVKSLLQGLFDRFVGDRLDLDEVKAHPWFEGIDWDQVRESARLQRSVPYAEELLGSVKPLIDAESDDLHHGGGRFISKVTVSELGDRDEYTPSLPKERRSSKLSPWGSAKLFSNKASGAKGSSGKRKVKWANHDYVKIWGYDYRAPGYASSISSSPVSSRRESRS